MKLQLLLCTVGVLVWPSSAQAPGDEQNVCNSLQSTMHTYPENWHLLMDSYNYENLVEGTGPVWRVRDFGGAGDGWEHGVGGICQNGMRACDDPALGQDDWFFTQYISYDKAALNACTITVEVIFDFTCDGRPAGCTRTVTMYRYDRNGIANENQQTERSNYNELQPLTDAQSAATTMEFTFMQPPNFEGFYLAVQETGICGTIRRLQVYYDVMDGNLWPDVTGLLVCPDVGYPTSGCTNPITSTCRCRQNAENATSLDIACSMDRTCTGNPSCGCSPGYEFVGGSCTACPIRMYQPLISATRQCMTCPANSDTFSEATAVCNCTFDFNRPSDEPDSPCTSPPSAPQISPTPANIDGTFVNVCWGAAAESGGRDDLHYNVYTLPEGGSVFTRANGSPIDPSGEIICYEISGLRSQTSYTIVVTSANGATNDPTEFEDLSQVENRFIAFYISTGEGGLRTSGAIAITFFVTLIFAAAIAVLVTILVVWFVFKPKWQQHGSSSSRERQTNGSPHNYDSNPAYTCTKPTPPPRPAAMTKNV